MKIETNDRNMKRNRTTAAAVAIALDRRVSSCLDDCMPLKWVNASRG